MRSFVIIHLRGPFEFAGKTTFFDVCPGQIFIPKSLVLVPIDYRAKKCTRVSGYPHNEEFTLGPGATC